MGQRILKIMKRIIFSAFLLYGYNLIASSIGIIIPINIITISILVIFGYPSLFSLILIQVLIF